MKIFSGVWEFLTEMCLLMVGCVWPRLESKGRCSRLWALARPGLLACLLVFVTPVLMVSGGRSASVADGIPWGDFSWGGAVVYANQLPPAKVNPDYHKVVAPFLKKYCGECHVGSSPEGEFRVDQEWLKSSLTDVVARNRWREVVNVLNSHEMPPKESLQPSAADVAKVVDWITSEAVRAELQSREQTTVLRRMNRDEYQRTIRDLVGVDFDVSGFPEDPAAGGFDNNGGALTVSPLHIELYLAAAQQILDRALVEGDRPQSVRWKFQPRAGPQDRTRSRLDERNNPIVNGGNNGQRGDWVVVHHNSWDKGVDARDFRVPQEGLYRIRAKMAGTQPTQAEVVKGVRPILEARRDREIREDASKARWVNESFERDLRHFQESRIYDYGPVRARVIVTLGPQPRTLAEFDVEGTPEQPQVLEWTTRMTTESAGIGFEYAYSIPSELENFWMQGRDEFPRPEYLISEFELEGPVYESWPPPSHLKLVGKTIPRPQEEREATRKLLAKFMKQAYRRPVTAAEIQEKLDLFMKARKSQDWLGAYQVSLISILTSPSFLFFVEPAAKSPPVALTEHQLATRLSYWLWSSMPDEELMMLADSGKLSQPTVLRQQVQRMLRNPKSQGFVENFAGQWLGLREVGANPPVKELYREYDRHLETSMVQESLAYFREFLDRNIDVRQMIQSDFVVINERLARFYGVDDVRGDHFRKVPVSPDVHRGGIVTQASILTITSNGTRTSPVKRGTWILKTLLGTDPGLPVANAGEISPKVPGIDKATVRQRLEIHRQLPQCARCHDKIDPLGFALENYNAAGKWRDREGFGYQGRIQDDDPLIDASSRMPDGTSIEGVQGLQNALMQRDDQFVEALSNRMLTYALGRELGLADFPQVKAVARSSEKSGYTLASMIEAIALSDAFRKK